MEMRYDENLEDELQTKIYPGTEIMADVGSVRLIKAGEGAGKVLVPQPSDDPHDPLNWNRFWKGTTITLSTATVFAQVFGPLALAPMFPELMEAFDRGLADVVQFVGVCILVWGFSNLIWVPMMAAFGRRPVLILSTLVCLVSSIWRAEAKTYGSFMGACVLNGIGAGPSETAQPQIIADVFFLHERGFWNTMYWALFFGSELLGTIIAGPMAYHVGWRNFWWLNTGLLGLVLILLIFFFPETKWHRAHPKELTHQSDKASTSVKPEARRQDSDDTEIGHNYTATKDNSVDQDTMTSTVNHNLEQNISLERDPHIHKGRPSRSQFNLLQWSPTPFRDILVHIYVPFKLFLYPICDFSSFVLTWSATSFLIVNLTQAQNFAAPPYNYSSQAIGFMNFATLFGSLVGLFTGGWLSDWFAARLTTRNKGIREPEMRLPTLVPFILTMILGNIVVTCGYQYKWPWEAIVLIGYTCAGIQTAAIPGIVTTYAVDSYKPAAGSIMVTITIVKNLWGYGVSRFITPWSIQDGWWPPVMMNMGLALLWCSFGIVFYFYGKKIRGWTKDSKVHDL